MNKKAQRKAYDWHDGSWRCKTWSTPSKHREASRTAKCRLSLSLSTAHATHITDRTMWKYRAPAFVAWPRAFLMSSPTEAAGPGMDTSCTGAGLRRANKRELRLGPEAVVTGRDRELRRRAVTMGKSRGGTVETDQSCTYGGRRRGIQGEISCRTKSVGYNKNRVRDWFHSSNPLADNRWVGNVTDEGRVFPGASGSGCRIRIALSVQIEASEGAPGGIRVQCKPSQQLTILLLSSEEVFAELG
jgi:hypothetical protein